MKPSDLGVRCVTVHGLSWSVLRESHCQESIVTAVYDACKYLRHVRARVRVFRPGTRVILRNKPLVVQGSVQSVLGASQILTVKIAATTTLLNPSSSALSHDLLLPPHKFQILFAARNRKCLSLQAAPTSTARNPSTT